MIKIYRARYTIDGKSRYVDFSAAFGEGYTAKAIDIIAAREGDGADFEITKIRVLVSPFGDGGSFF